MPIPSWPTIGDTINAQDLKDRLETIETFVNLDIDGDRDLKDDGAEQFETKHVYKPDLFGSPSPRFMAVSGQTHWRNVSNDWSSGVMFNSGTIGYTWVPVPGLCTRIKLTQRANVHFSSSFYCFEVGGATEVHSHRAFEIRNEKGSGKVPGIGSVTRSTKLDAGSFGHEYEVAGTIALMVNGEDYTTTYRQIHTANLFPCNSGNQVINGSHIMFQMISRHHQSITRTISLEAGWHDIGIAFRPNTVDYIGLTGVAPANTGGVLAQEHKHMYFLARSMVADCVYIDD